VAAHPAWALARRALGWGIPGALVATLIWTLLPHVHPEAGPSPPAPGAAGTGSPSGRAPAAGGPPPAGAARAGGAAQAGRAPASPSPGASGRAAPYALIQEGDLTGTDNTGRQRWRIVADSVVLLQNGDRVLLRNIRATFYQRDGGTIQLTGRSGWFDTRRHEVEIDGAVKGISSSGRQLFADRLHWSAASGRILGTGHIRLVQASVVMYADEMESNTLLGETRFHGHVHASLP
jgi:LPS export ABC transporter protein LptC